MTSAPVDILPETVACAARFISSHFPGLDLSRAGRVAGYPCFIGVEDDCWTRGFVVRPVATGMRALTRDMQDVCAAAGFAARLDFVDLATVDVLGRVAVYHNVYRAA